MAKSSSLPTVKELKKLCKEHGLKTSGKKATLKSRLRKSGALGKSRRKSRKKSRKKSRRY